jgi:hypothetical protein
MKLTSTPALIALGSLILGLGGCTTAPKLNTEYDKETDFTKAKTFVIRPIPKDIPGVDPGLVMRVGPAAAGAVRTAMTGKGYVEVTEPARADIAILIHGKQVPKTDITDWGFTPYAGGGYYGGYYGMHGGAYMGSSVSVDQYDEGTLIVEVYDVKTRKMIWVGWGVARMTTKTDEQAANVATGITNLLASYPVVGNQPPPPPPKK